MSTSEVPLKNPAKEAAHHSDLHFESGRWRTSGGRAGGDRLARGETACQGAGTRQVSCGKAAL